MPEKLACRACQSNRPTAWIDPHTWAGYCLSCKAVFTLDGYPDVAASEIKRPARITESREGQQLTLKVRGSSIDPVLAGGFFGIMCMLFWVMVSELDPLRIGIDDTLGIFMMSLACCAALHFFLYNLLNRTTLSINDTALRTHTGPMPWPWRCKDRTLATSQITALRCDARKVFLDDTPFYVFRVRDVAPDGTITTLIDHLAKPVDALYLQGQLNTRLGQPDHSVA